jgi:hypothetical protein
LSGCSLSTQGVGRAIAVANGGVRWWLVCEGAKVVPRQSSCRQRAQRSGEALVAAQPDEIHGSTCGVSSAPAIGEKLGC